MQNWDDLKYLLALEQQGTLTKAAQQLGTNLTTVSRHIKRLSETYKETLVQMHRGGEWSLTEHGTRFVEAARRCQSEIEQLSGDGTYESDLTISTLEFIAVSYLAPKLERLSARQNGIDLTINCGDENVSLAYGEADLAIRLGRPKSGRLFVSKLGDVEMSIFTPDGKHSTEWIGLPQEYDWVPEMQLAFAHFQSQPTIRLGSFSGIRRLSFEMGIAAVGPTKMFEGWNGLAKMPGTTGHAYREAWCIHHEGRRQDEKLAKLREWVKTCFSANRLQAVA